MKAFSLSLSFVAVLALFAGCVSTGSVQVGDDDSWPRLTERVLDTDLFLEVVEPEPSYLKQEADQLAQWRTADYQADRKRGMQELMMPESYRLTLDEFRRNPDHERVSGPYLLLQLREREFVEGVKEHQVETKSLFSGSTSLGTKKVKVWRRWRWTPGAVVGGDSVDIVAIEHEFSPGVISRYSGVLDEEGRIRFYLSPLLRAAGSQVKGTTIVLQASCPAKKKVTEIRVELEAVLRYQQLLAEE